MLFASLIILFLGKTTFAQLIDKNRLLQIHQALCKSKIRALEKARSAKDNSPGARDIDVTYYGLDLTINVDCEKISSNVLTHCIS